MRITWHVDSKEIDRWIYSSMFLLKDNTFFFGRGPSKDHQRIYMLYNIKIGFPLSHSLIIIKVNFCIGIYIEQHAMLWRDHLKYFRWNGHLIESFQQIMDVYLTDVNSTAFFNITIETEKFKTLEQLNNERATQRLPTILFLCILIVTGVIGNSIVLLVYGLKYSPSTFRVYILSLAVIDLLSCTIAIPLELVDNLLPLMFYSEGVCKVGRFLGNVFKIGSALVLMVMAIGRYRKICRPFSEHDTMNQARLSVGIAICVSVLLSWPNAIIQGTKLRRFPGNITGHDCSIDDDVLNTQFPFIYSTLLFVVYAITFIVLSVLYTLVIIQLRKHARKQTSFKFNNKVQKMNPRITKLMIAITLAFILCYLPNCILDAGTTFKRGYLFPASPLVLGLLPLLSRTFFINNVINPFIYLIGETKFREICHKLFSRCCRVVCTCRMDSKSGHEALNSAEETRIRLTDMKATGANNTFSEWKSEILPCQY